jgi:hypothetical protein
MVATSFAMLAAECFKAVNITTTAIFATTPTLTYAEIACLAELLVLRKPIISSNGDCPIDCLVSRAPRRLLSETDGFTYLFVSPHADMWRSQVINRFAEIGIFHPPSLI